MNPAELKARKDEFRTFVWDHAADAFQAKFDQRAHLTQQECRWLRRVLAPEHRTTADALAAAIREGVHSAPDMLPVLLQVVGLTRNKIIQDIKGFCRARGERVSLSSPRAIFRTERGRELGGAYLARQTLRVLPMDVEASVRLLECLNQATWPGYIRQERAKRMGHEAEYRIAVLFRDCGIPFAPEEKAENPLCKDLKMKGQSYDLVSPAHDNALVRIRSTVHSANIGRYGESKDHLELLAAARAIAREPNRSRITLLAFIDGVGFESNRVGLDGVLSVADEFCQFRTIWKAAVIGGCKIGKHVHVRLPKDQMVRFKPFVGRYGGRISPREGNELASSEWVQAGDGSVERARS